jgi:hypothetical protein
MLHVGRRGRRSSFAAAILIQSVVQGKKRQDYDPQVARFGNLGFRRQIELRLSQARFVTESKRKGDLENPPPSTPLFSLSLWSPFVDSTHCRLGAGSFLRSWWRPWGAIGGRGADGLALGRGVCRRAAYIRTTDLTPHVLTSLRFNTSTSKLWVLKHAREGRRWRASCGTRL